MSKKKRKLEDVNEKQEPPKKPRYEEIEGEVDGRRMNKKEKRRREEEEVEELQKNEEVEPSYKGGKLKKKKKKKKKKKEKLEKERQFAKEQEEMTVEILNQSVEDSKMTDGKKPHKKRKRMEEDETFRDVESEEMTLDKTKKKKKKKRQIAKEQEEILTKISTQSVEDSVTLGAKKHQKKREGMAGNEQEAFRNVEPEEAAEVGVEKTERKKKKKRREKEREREEEAVPSVLVNGGQELSDSEVEVSERKKKRKKKKKKRKRKEEETEIHISFESEDEYAALHQTTAPFKPEGTERRKGQFTSEELKQIQTNITKFCNGYGIADPADVIFNSNDYSKELRSDFFRAAARHVARTLHSVYRRLLRKYNDANYGGQFTDDENSELVSLKRKHGTNWKLIGDIMGRSGQSCLDRARTQPGRRGVWSNQEAESLVEAMRGLAEENGTDLMELPERGLPWDEVSRQMGTRNFGQCRQKWLQNLKSAVVDNPYRFRFTKVDQARLIEIVHSHYEKGARCGDDVPWEEIARGWEGARARSYAHLRLVWGNIVRTMPDYQVESFEEQVEYAYEAVLPALVQWIFRKET